MASSFHDQVGQSFSQNAFHHPAPHMLSGMPDHAMYPELLYYDQMSMMPLAQVAPLPPPASLPLPSSSLPPPLPSEAAASPFPHQDITALGSYLMLGYEPAMAHVSELEPYYYPSAFRSHGVAKPSKVPDTGAQSPRQGAKKEPAPNDVSKMFESFYSTPTGEFKPCFYNPFEVKHRKRTSRSQFKVLEKAFQENPKPAASVRRTLAAKVGMTSRGVQVWFQNRRAKLKIHVPKGVHGSTPHDGSFKESESVKSQDTEEDDDKEASGPYDASTELASDASQIKALQDTADQKSKPNAQARSSGGRLRSESNPELAVSLKSPGERAAAAGSGSVENSAPTLGILTFTNGSQVYNEIKPFRDQRFPSTSGLDLALKRIGKGALASPEWTSQTKGHKETATAKKKSRAARRSAKNPSSQSASEADAGTLQTAAGDELLREYIVAGGAHEKRWPAIAPAMSGSPSSIVPVPFLASTGKASALGLRKEPGSLMLSPSACTVGENTTALPYDISQCPSSISSSAPSSSSFLSSSYYPDQLYYSPQPPHPSSLPQWHIPYDAMSQYEPYGGRPRAVSMPVTLYPSGFQSGAAAGQLHMDPYTQSYTSGL